MHNLSAEFNWELCFVYSRIAHFSTKKAMNGGMGFREALKLRLGLMQPHWQQIEQFLIQHPPKLTAGIVELIEFLHRKGVHVYLISGGFTCVILPVAEDLGIPESRVFANELQFDQEGNYVGFDETREVSNSGGKGTLYCSFLQFLQIYELKMFVNFKKFSIKMTSKYLM